MSLTMIVLMALGAVAYLHLTGVIAFLLCRVSPRARRRGGPRDLASRRYRRYGPRDRS